MERHFDDELKELRESVLSMGRTAQGMIEKATQALVERNDGLTQEVFALENVVNQMHVDIDERCVKLMALHQPMAVDLRFIAAAMKINNDLERIGDQAVNTSQTCFYHLFKEPPVPQASMIPHMARIAEQMLKDSLTAFANRDTNLAFSVLAQEKEEDRLKTEALTDLIDLIQQEPYHSKQFVDLILISRNMERIGDHATNIAEDVIFMVMGRDIRHYQVDPSLLPSSA